MKNLIHILLALFLGASVASMSIAGMAHAQEASANAPILLPVDETPLTIERDGEIIAAFDIEVADDPSERSRGLMFRTELGDHEGMIFPYDGTTAQSFWMKNTPLALDIIYIGPDGRISNIAAMTEPYSLEPVYSVGPVLGVLELRGGRAEELGVSPGDLVEW